MIQKNSILTPVLILVVLAGMIISANTGEPAVSEVKEEPEEAVASEELEMSKHNPANPKSSGQQPASSSFDGTVEGFLAAVHKEWHELSPEEKTDSSVSAESYGIVASVVPEINFLDAQIDNQWTWKFYALQETGHQLTSPVIDLTKEERDGLIPIFEDELNRLFENLVTQS